MRAQDLQPGDIVISRDDDGRIYEARMVQTIDDDSSVRRAKVQTWWPNEPTRIARSADIVSYFGANSELEVIR